MGIYKETLELTSSKAIKNGRRIDRLEKRIEQLECPHDELAFNNHCKECIKCGKIFENYYRENDMLEAKARYYKDGYLKIVENNEEVRKAVEG